MGTILQFYSVQCIYESHKFCFQTCNDVMVTSLIFFVVGLYCADGLK